MTIPGPHPAAAGAATSAGAGVLLLTDFKTGSPDLGWYVQNDNVMGGRSQGGFEIPEQGPLIFSGSTNTNGGGFSSIRTRAFALDLSKYDGLQLRVKADGRQYIWQLQTSARYGNYEVSYWAEFATVAGEWTTVRIPFSSFYPQFRGYRLEGPGLDKSDIREFGLYIYDKKDGPFKLQLDNVSAFAAESP